MQYEVEIGGRTHKVLVSSAGDGFAVTVGTRTWHVSAARVDSHLLSLVLNALSPKDDTAAPSRPTGQAAGAIGPGMSWEVVLGPGGGSGGLVVGIGAAQVAVTSNGRRRHKKAGRASSGGPQTLVAPMPGRVVRILVKPGDQVRVRQPLVVVEAMKMENELRADSEGRVTAVHVKEGASVDAGALLVEIE